MENPSAEPIKKRVEDLTGIVDWVAEIWHSKNRVRRLLLLDVVLFVAFNRYFPTVLKLIPGSFIPNRYDLYFWAVVGIFFAIALVIGVGTKAVRTAPPPDKRSSIKRLLAFDTADEEVFARLQRHNELIECAQAITDHNFRFGILSADSGNGKTSFLQAGLSPALRKRDHRCVYVKFAELDPVVSIRQANDEDSKSSALLEVAKVMAGIGAKQRDEDLLRRAQGVAEMISDEDYYYKPLALVWIAQAMAEIGAKQQAIDLLKQAQGAQR